MTSNPDSWRVIGWNTILLNCPQQWETIVSGDNHILFEENFHPLLEIRWQKKGKNKKQTTHPVLRKLARESELLVMDELPASWKKLETLFQIRLLADPKSRELKAALLTCTECEATFLLYFFNDFATQHHWDLLKFLSSIDCHGQSERELLWSLQDFQIVLPAGFKLISYNFAAGLTRLTFKDAKSLTMHICRLASATQRLEESTLTSLMTLLGDVTVPEEEIMMEKNSVSHCSYPSITTQILSRFKRKSPFHYLILRHHPEHDRLSGLFFFDKKPLPEELVTSTLNSYEIFSL